MDERACVLLRAGALTLRTAVATLFLPGRFASPCPVEQTLRTLLVKRYRHKGSRIGTIYRARPVLEVEGVQHRVVQSTWRAESHRDG